MESKSGACSLCAMWDAEYGCTYPPCGGAFVRADDVRALVSDLECRRSSLKCDLDGATRETVRSHLQGWLNGLNDAIVHFQDFMNGGNVSNYGR